MGFFDIFSKKDKNIDEIDQEFNNINKKDDIVGYLNAMIGLSEVNKSSITDNIPGRPVDFGYEQMYGSGISKRTLIPNSFLFTQSLVYSCDVLRTVIRSIVWETFRNGCYIEDKFLFKCRRCGADYSEPVEKCEVCGTDDFKKPFKKQKQRLEKWIQKANLNSQTMLEVMEDIDWNLNMFDNAYIIVRKEYFFNKDNRIIGVKPTEILSGDVKRIGLVINKDGRLGFDDDNNMLFICPHHRSNIIKISPQKVKNVKYIKCPICGKECIQIMAEYGVNNGAIPGMTNNNSVETLYLGKGEILHIKKFSPGIGYGFPMPLSVATKVMLLMKMDHYALASYTMGRPPKGLLVLKANRESVAKAWQMLEEMSKRNPWMIAPLTIEGFDKYGSGKVAEFIDLSLKIDEPGLIQYRDELRRTIGACYGVMPLFQGDMSVGGGLNNEGLQITVTNRAVEQEQKIFNEQIFPWLCKQLNISDFIIKLKSHEEKDMSAQLQREQMRLQIAQQLIQMGYKVDIINGNDGIEYKLGDVDVDVELVNILDIWAKQNIGADIRNIDMSELLEVVGMLIKEPYRIQEVLMQQMNVQPDTNLNSQNAMDNNEVGSNELGDDILNMIDNIFDNEGSSDEANHKVSGKNNNSSGMPDLDLD